jgi:hypothetical protein
MANDPHKILEQLFVDNPGTPRWEKVKGVLDAAYEKGRHDAATDSRLQQIVNRPDLDPRAKVRELEKYERELTSTKTEFGRDIRRLELLIKAHTELEAWIKGEMVLGRPEASILHRLIGAIKHNKLIIPERDESKAKPTDFARSFGRGTQSFVVQHDWASAFANATDFDEGDFALPYDDCCFEFRITGKRVLVLARIENERLAFAPFVLTEAGWVPLDEYHGGEIAESESFGRLICSQIRAVSIALDADVAMTEVTRVPAKLNVAREKRGEMPLFDHHVVSLARRTRAAPLDTPTGRTHRSPRLHFRRGHWRRYETYKTWIRWTLVGNLDLGYIEKEYRL